MDNHDAWVWAYIFFLVSPWANEKLMNKKGKTIKMTSSLFLQVKRGIRGMPIIGHMLLKGDLLPAYPPPLLTISFSLPSDVHTSLSYHRASLLLPPLALHTQHRWVISSFLLHQWQCRENCGSPKANELECPRQPSRTTLSFFSMSSPLLHQD